MRRPLQTRVSKAFIVATTFCSILQCLAAEKSLAPSRADFAQFGRNLVKIMASDEERAIQRLMEDLKLPGNAEWFDRVFGAAVGARVNREYAEILAKMKELRTAFQETISAGKTDVKVDVFERAIDMNANGLQNYALQMMVEPERLFTLRFVKPGEERGTAFWSFVFADGRFRYVGKMKALRLGQTQGDLTSDVLDALPLGEAEKLLKDKGMPEGAVGYLQQRGLLLKASKRTN